MTPEAAAEAWRAGTAEGDLLRLWEEYATTLHDMRDALAPGDPERFPGEVLAPYQLPNSTRQGGPAISAVNAWGLWRPDVILPRQDTGPQEFAHFRDELTRLLERIKEYSERNTGWFSRRTETNPLTDPKTQTLIGHCIYVFDELARGKRAQGNPAIARLRTLADDVDSLLEAAPDGWPPRAGCQYAHLVRFLIREPSSASLLRESSIARMHVAMGKPEIAVEAAAAFADGFAAEVSRGAHSLAEVPPNRSNWLDPVLAYFRGWGAGFGIEFLPRRWSFARPPALDEVRGDGVELIPVYRPNAPRGSVVRLKTIGLARDGTVIRPAVVVVSAGPAPVGLAELEEAVRESPHPAAEAVRAGLREWRAASLEGRLEAAAVGLYVEVWDRLRGDLPPEVGDRLAVVLAEEFGLTPFHPGNFRDHPDRWVQVAGGRMATGRVREVIRPGLVTRVGELRVPARVVVE